MPYPELEASVRSRVHEYFTHQIMRPEILDRLGDNIIVFDFLGPDVVREVFDHQLRNIQRHLIDHHSVNLVLTANAVTTLCKMCTGSTVSGREISNHIESYLINPLARYLFDNDCPPYSRLTVIDILRKPDAGVELAITVESPDKV
jgi:ATP-dependent Clp protease ATP-binding subunit ClpB